MNECNEWELLYVMPCFSSSKSYENGYLAIMPVSDSRIEQMCSNNKSLKKYLDLFISAQKKELDFTVMVRKRQFTQNIYSDEAVASFRNIVALSILPLEHAISINGTPSYFWSDNFDFHPVLYRDNRLVINEPGYRYVSAKEFINIDVHVSTHIHVPQRPDNIIDEVIYTSLLSCWKMSFDSQTKDNKLSSLFRSLEIAYHALASPRKNIASTYDLGITVILWISAIETLLRSINRDVNKKVVNQYLGKYIWSNPKLKQNIYENNNQNLIQCLCLLLYKLRNDFSHGNPITQDKQSLIDKENPALSEVAIVIYRTVLNIFLDEQYQLEKLQDEELSAKLQQRDCMLFEELLLKLEGCVQNDKKTP